MRLSTGPSVTSSDAFHRQSAVPAASGTGGQSPTGVRLVLSIFACSFVCFGQQWELGAGSGYGFYRNASIDSPAGSANAGFRDNYVITAWFGQDLYEHVSGEFRYTYQNGGPFIQSGGLQTGLQGQSNAFHYDALFHFRRRHVSIRPYLAAGIGAKIYVVSGPAILFQPLSPIGLLTTNDETKFLASFGAGITLSLGSWVRIRLDFRDYITAFPSKLIVPAPGGSSNGILHQLTPMAGIAFAF
jgi:hypothetical protein